jgi:hypothetical protein
VESFVLKILKGQGTSPRNYERRRVLMRRRVLVGGITALLLSVSIVVLFQANVAKADELYASIRGTVADQTGAAVPGVTVIATNAATGVSQRVTSGSDGTYGFLQLPVGDYIVRAEKTGFRAFNTTQIHLDVNQVYTLPVQMSLGEMSQEVTVQANPTQVEMTTPQLGVVIDANQIVNMPLIGRNFVNLQALQPGVVGASDRFGDNYNYATNGGQSQFNVFLIDGTDTNDLPLNTTTFVPSADAIQEFRMVSSTLNPEYARSSGAILNALMKSGTNSLHGDAFEFYRDTFLNAKDYFTHNRQIYHQNEFGATIGGPVIKNHTFFFFSYQGERARNPQPGEETLNPVVYTPAQRAGTFGSSVTSSHVSPFPLWGDPCPPSGAQCPAGTPYSTLFASGNIPKQDFNSLSSGLVNKYVPLPNSGGGTQFAWNGTRQVTDNQFLVRIDQSFNSRDSLWGTWFVESFPVDEAVPFFGATLPGFGESNKEHFKFLTLSWTHIVNDHMVNEIRGAYNRFNYDAVEPTTPVQPKSLGFNITPQDTAGAAMPVMDVQGMFHLGFSMDGPQPRIDQMYQAVDNFSLIEGRHTLKFGFDMRRWQVFNPFLSNNDGYFVFRNYGTYSTGNAGADFLLGIPTRYIQASGSLEDSRGQQYYSYAQDQFKLRSNLTLTYGVGWTIDTPMSNQAFGGHGQVAFRAGQQSIVFPNAPLGVVYQGDPGVHAAGSTKPWRQFGPRFGFAYSPDWGGWLTGGPGKTSIRGGFGIYYDRSETEQADQVVGMPPFAISSVLGVQSQGSPALQINPSFVNPFADIATGARVANPFPFVGPSSRVPFTTTNGNLPVFTFCCAVLDGGTRDPMAENYNLTIERQLTPSTILSVGYVGSVAHHLTYGVPLNLATGLDATTGNVTFQYDTGTYGSIDTLFSGANSNYHSLQVTVNKRLTRGLQFLTSYTYSHSIDESSGFENSTFGTFGGESGGFALLRATNPYCSLRCEYASSIYDARQRLVISYFYEIPGLHGDWLVSRLTRGWTIAGITTFQTGFPLDIIDSAAPSGGCFGSGDFGCWDGPNQVGAVHYSNPRSSSMWFNPSAFAPVACEAAGCTASGVSPTSVLSYGNAPRNPLRGPGLNNWDFQIYKDTQINERMRVELRIESYNVFNHTQFDPNGVITDIGAPNFGAITLARNPRRFQLATKFYF